jgi:outer membrane lipoprotein-sorting protein
MFEKSSGVRCGAALLTVAMATSLGAATASSSVSGLSATEIVDRNVVARGGLQAWRAVQALSLSGKMDAGGNSRPTLRVPGVKPAAGSPSRPKEQMQLPFVMQLKRPHKVRVELQFQGQTAVQVFDGTNGWKVRPFLNRHEVEPYTPDELKAAGAEAELDGPLIDYAAKGSKVELDGTEKIEDHDTYRLKLTTKSGSVQHVWVDARTFLETKVEGTPRRLDGRYHPVDIYFRDYRPVEGLKVAHVLETVVRGVPQREKTEIEKVTVNPKLDDALFAKPQ